MTYNSFAAFKTEKWHTDNGVTVVFYQAKEVPMLDLSMAFAAGSAYDGDHFGLSALTTQMLNEGNKGIEASVIAERLANTGAQFDASTTRDMITLNLRTLTTVPALTEATDILQQIINHPDFPPAAFARQKQQMLMAVTHREESPDELATINFFKTLYQNHPYAHPVNGTAKSIKQLTREQVIHFYKQYFVARNAVLVMVGAINSKQAHELADKISHELPAGTHASAISKAAQLPNAQQINIPYPSSQTVLRLGQLGIDHQNQHYFPLIIGNYILGGGSLVSRLAVEVREKRGLTYGVDSQMVPMPGEGPFLISLSTRTNQANNALQITKNILNQFVEKGPSNEELTAAKDYLIGSFPLSLSSNRAIANVLLHMSFYNLPDDYLDTYAERIKAVTGEEIKQAFQQQVDPAKMLLVTVGQS